MKRQRTTFRVYDAEQPRTITLTGQNARCLLALIEAGNRGANALAVSSWALRFGAYVWEMRHRYGVPIAMERVDHDNHGGWHGVYRLLCRVEVVEPEPAAAVREAA